MQHVNNIRVERNSVFKLTAAAAASVWLKRNGQQDTLHASLAASEELILGPYLNITEFRIESTLPVTISNQAADFSIPVKLRPAAAAVDNAADDTEVTAQFNALLVSLRAAGYLAGTAPENTILPEITGTTESGETLTVDDGTWTGDATITYTYQWLRDGVAIAGETSDTYDAVEDDEGSLIGCIVTATNLAGSVQAYAVAVGPITAPEE